MRTLPGLRALFICSAALLSACISFQTVDETGQTGRVEIDRITVDSHGSRLEATVSPDGCWTFPGVDGGLKLTLIWALSTLSVRVSRCAQANTIVLDGLDLSAPEVRFQEISLGKGIRRLRTEFPIELDDSLQFLCEIDGLMKFGREVAINVQVTIDQEDSYTLVAQGTTRPFK